jgi:hypothetical protein
MDAMEADMKSLDTQVTEALQRLQALVDESSQPFLDAAWAAYKDFQHINADIVALSRQNSNIRSYALSLGQQRKTTAQCQDVLTTLQETVQQSMAYKATR